jgi:threonine/homoserine/homoserine lactone efflux protein
VDTGVTAAFWVVSLLLVLVPGPDWAYAVAAGLGGRPVVPAVCGLVLGYVALTAVVAAGVAAVVVRTPAMLSGLTVAGAVYLTWLGTATVRTAGGTGAPAAPRRHGARSALLAGAGTSGLNPKGLLLVVALLPQFTDTAAPWPLAVQTVVLGLVHAANCGAVYLAVGLLARRVIRTRPSVTRAVTLLSGVVMVILGVALVAERFVLSP